MSVARGDNPNSRPTAARRAAGFLACAMVGMLVGSCRDGSGNLSEAWGKLWKPKSSPAGKASAPEGDEGLYRPYLVGPDQPGPVLGVLPTDPPAKAPSLPTTRPAPRPAGPTSRPLPTTRPRRPSRLRLPVKEVLFVGNRYSTYHDMPEMIQALALAAREPVRLRIATVAPDGCTLSKHWFETTARKTIRTGGWEWVVLQEQSTRPLIQRNLMFRFAREFDTEAHNFGAKTMFFLTWCRQNRPTSQREINAAYLTIAKELKSELAPVGIAWRMAAEQRPGLVLYQKDMSAPTVAGAYLTACVFYSKFFGRTPQGLPGTLRFVTPQGKKKILAEIQPANALFLQRTAWEAVREGERLMKAR